MSCARNGSSSSQSIIQQENTGDRIYMLKWIHHPVTQLLGTQQTRKRWNYFHRVPISHWKGPPLGCRCWHRLHPGVNIKTMQNSKRLQVLPTSTYFGRLWTAWSFKAWRFLVVWVWNSKICEKCCKDCPNGYFPETAHLKRDHPLAGCLQRTTNHTCEGRVSKGPTRVALADPSTHAPYDHGNVGTQLEGHPTCNQSKSYGTRVSNLKSHGWYWLIIISLIYTLYIYNIIWYISEYIITA